MAVIGWDSCPDRASAPLTAPRYSALESMTPDSTLTTVLCLVVLAVLAIAAGYSVAMSFINYSAIGV